MCYPVFMNRHLTVRLASGLRAGLRNFEETTGIRGVDYLNPAIKDFLARGDFSCQGIHEQNGVVVNLRLDQEIFDALEATEKKSGVRKAELLRRALNHFLARTPEENAGIASKIKTVRHKLPIHKSDTIFVGLADGREIMLEDVVRVERVVRKYLPPGAF